MSDQINSASFRSAQFFPKPEGWVKGTKEPAHVDHSTMLGISKPAVNMAQGLPEVTTSYCCQFSYRTNSIIGGGWDVMTHIRVEI